MQVKGTYSVYWSGIQTHSNLGFCHLDCGMVAGEGQMRNWNLNCFLPEVNNMMLLTGWTSHMFPNLDKRRVGNVMAHTKQHYRLPVGGGDWEGSTTSWPRRWTWQSEAPSTPPHPCSVSPAHYAPMLPTGSRTEPWESKMLWGPPRQCTWLKPVKSSTQTLRSWWASAEIHSSFGLPGQASPNSHCWLNLPSTGLARSVPDLRSLLVLHE